MKLIQLLTFLILCLSFSLSSCKNKEAEAIRQQARENLPAVSPNATPAAPATQTPPATPSVNSNEPHYKCPKNCVGGTGASKGACPVCGTELAHNQAYHNNPTAPTSPTINPATPAPNPAIPEPAQNAAGVYHYTCSNGCSGGAGSAGSCGSCGGALAHNPAYHN